jgi:ACS family tartrate transporter-like MFS transporter
MTLAPAGASAPDLSGSAHHTRRHIALRLLPFLFILYIVNYLDRTSVAYAAVAMSHDLGFSDRVYGLGTGVFFISYLALQIPGALLVERWSARRVICVTMVAWGSLTALTGLVHSTNQLYVARFLLGVAEGCFFPGVIVYLSHWFIVEDRAKATSNFMGAIPLSFVMGSPIAGWILGHPWRGLAGWRWLFVVEGSPAIVLGAVAFFFLTDWPREAAWLAPEGRDWVEQTLRDEKPAGAAKVSMGQALKSRAVLLLASLTLFQYAVIYSFAFWFPTMLKRQSGLSDMRLGWLGAVPYTVAFIVMQVNAWHSDRQQERRWHSVFPLLIAAMGSLGLIIQPHSLVLSLVLFSMVATVLAYLPTFWAIPTEILSQSAAAAAVGMINAVGNTAGFAGPYLFGYLNTRTGSLSAGLALMALCGVAGGLGILCVPRTGRR